MDKINNVVIRGVDHPVAMEAPMIREVEEEGGEMMTMVKGR